MKEIEKQFCSAVHDCLTNWNECLTPISSNKEIDDMVECIKKVIEQQVDCVKKNRGDCCFKDKRSKIMSQEME